MTRALLIGLMGVLIGGPVMADVSVGGCCTMYLSAPCQWARFTNSSTASECLLRLDPKSPTRCVTDSSACARYTSNQCSDKTSEQACKAESGMHTLRGWQPGGHCGGKGMSLCVQS